MIRREVLLNGVEILNIYKAEIDHYINWHSPYLIWTIISIIAAIGFLVLLMYWLDDEPIVGVFAGLAFIAPIMLMTQLSEPIYETHYDVIISDEVSLVEFNEKYEVIEIRGKIYEVRERNDFSE